MPKSRRRFRGKAAGVETKGSLPSPKPYDVDMTESATTVYSDLYRRAKEAEDKGDPTNSVCTTFRMVQEAIKAFIPRDPINKKYALSGELSNIFRLKKGRLRICWIASSRMRRVCILFISESLRKEGDVNDPYRVFTKMVMSGELDDFFARLGVRKPTVNPMIQ
jgi:mRNA-degrading endonuclease RelE of RelBE toxin-antitoxin system